MEKMRKIFRKLRRYLRERKMYQIAKDDAQVMRTPEIRMLPPDFNLKRSKEELLVETQRSLHEYRMKYCKSYAEENAGKSLEEKIREYKAEFMKGYEED